MIMLKGTFPLNKFKALPTPFYYYNMELLKETLQTVKAEASKEDYHVYNTGSDCQYHRHS